MKRNEMLNNLLDFVHKNNWRIVYNYEDGSHTIDKFDVEELLDFIEELGMLPPLVKNSGIPEYMNQVEHATQKVLDELYNNGLSNVPSDFLVSEWEDEKE